LARKVRLILPFGEANAASRQATVDSPPVPDEGVAVVSGAEFFGVKPPLNFSSSFTARVSFASTAAESPSEATLFDCGKIGVDAGLMGEMLVIGTSFSCSKDFLKTTKDRGATTFHHR
jgi:hypothetical protein